MLTEDQRMLCWFLSAQSIGYFFFHNFAVLTFNKRIVVFFIIVILVAGNQSFTISWSGSSQTTLALSLIVLAIRLRSAPVFTFNFFWHVCLTLEGF